MKEVIEQLNEKINAFASETAVLNIENGKMGFCLYFFMLADSLKNKQYRQWAEKLLDEMYEQLSQNLSVKLISDIMQVGVGIDFLLTQKYVEGNINKVLGDVDDVLFQKITSYNNTQKLTYETPGFLYILYYLYLRIEKQKSNSGNRFLMEELIIKTFNDIYVSLNSAFYDEPVLFNLDYKLPPFLFALSKIYSLNFYNYRIDEVIKEMSGLIQSRIPALHANRLYLLWGLVHLKQATGFSFWDEQMNLIYHSINIQKIIVQELRNKQVFIKNGVAGIYLLLAAMEKTEYQILYDPEMFRKRIYDSGVWKENSQQPLAFANGMGGLLWVDHLLNQKINAL